VFSDTGVPHSKGGSSRARTIHFMSDAGIDAPQPILGEATLGRFDSR